VPCTVAADIDAEGNTCVWQTCDITKPAQCDALAQLALDTYGGIDVLVNNASGFGHKDDEAGWAAGINIDIMATVRASHAQACAKVMRPGSAIVNIASISGIRGSKGRSAYGASKGAVINLTKVMATDLATQGIYVNCVTPAVIETDILQQLTDEAVAYMVAKIPMGRVGQPAEVAALVSWLASEECTFSTGAVFDISGGRATY